MGAVPTQERASLASAEAPPSDVLPGPESSRPVLLFPGPGLGPPCLSSLGHMARPGSLERPLAASPAHSQGPSWRAGICPGAELRAWGAEL